MAFVEKHGHNLRVVFRYNGQRFTHTLQTTNREVADGILGGVKKTLMLLKQCVLHLPQDADVMSFVLSGGQVQQPTQPSKVNQLTVNPPNASSTTTLEALKTRYIDTLQVGAIEKNSLETVNMHLRHFIRTLGAEFQLQTLTLPTLQGHVSIRAKQRGIRQRSLSPTTMKKEIASLRAAWNWGVQSGLLIGPFPNRGLKYP